MQTSSTAKLYLYVNKWSAVVSSYPSINMLEQCHVTACGTPEQPKGLTNSDFTLKAKPRHQRVL